MTHEGRERLHRIERRLAVMYADELAVPLIPNGEAAWLLGILRAWDQVRTLLDTGQIKTFPYEQSAEVLR